MALNKNLEVSELRAGSILELMREIVILFRPSQYVKNVFIFAPLLFSFAFTVSNFVNALIAFLLFSMMASSIYIFNDLMDIEEDKRHPVKKNRPLTRGTVSSGIAKFLILLLFLVSVSTSFFLNRALMTVLLIYFGLNLAYSLKLKHIAIVDIAIIASGFVLRLFAGSVVTGINLSVWIITITFLLALFLALAKRRDDILLASAGNHTRKNIDGYNIEFINIAMSLMAGVIIVIYILYTLSPEAVGKTNNSYLYVTTLFVILGIFRYMKITFVDRKSGNPTEIVLKDTFLQATIVLWFTTFIGLVLF